MSLFSQKALSQDTRLLTRHLVKTCIVRYLFILPDVVLFVHVDDVFHQKISLQTVDSMTVQYNFMPAGWTPETAT